VRGHHLTERDPAGPCELREGGDPVGVELLLRVGEGDELRVFGLGERIVLAAAHELVVARGGLRGQRAVGAVEQRGLLAGEERRDAAGAPLEDALGEGGELVGRHLVHGSEQLFGGDTRLDLDRRHGRGYHSALSRRARRRSTPPAEVFLPVAQSGRAARGDPTHPPYGTFRRITMRPRHGDTAGPYRPEHLRSGDPYELSNGRKVECLPTGGDGTGPNGRGFLALDTDPMAANAGVDLGMQLGSLTMRAPDVAVGAFAEKQGWVQGALPLALEYAASGQDEEKLQERIADLLAHGVKYVWVVQLIGPRRVEVHEKGLAMRTVLPGQTLTAPGVLKNPVRVEALYDRDAAHEAALCNLLQRRGYESLDAVRAEGLGPLEHLCERRLGRALADAERATLRARLATHGPQRLGDVVLDLDAPALGAWLAASDAR